MAKKKVGIVMDEDIHARMKSIAGREKRKVEDVYLSAVVRWLKDNRSKSGY